MNEWDNEVDPPVSKLPGGLAGTVEMLFNRGKIITARKEDKIICVSGYTLGEPINNFKDRSIGYVYTTIIVPEYRGRIFRGFIKKTITEMENDKVIEARFKANIQDNYSNKIYSKLGKNIGEEENTQGVMCNLYSVSLEELLDKYCKTSILSQA